MPLVIVPPQPFINKLVFAVHGIGDQTKNSTILSTAAQFAQHYGYRALLPLGGFHDTLQNGRPPFVITNPPQSAFGPINTVGFAEIYWADLAREIATAGYTLQETKAWCRSVVSRVRVLAERREPGRRDIHYGQIQYVLEEAIDAIGVIESLLFLARKTGVLDFNLKGMLDDYLGDVQLVTEFADIRAGIVKRLHDDFGKAYALYPNAEIHIVAHSEGTVVAWLGLLQAACDPGLYPWIKNVRGFMTIGSPIDKHLILWRDLFKPFETPKEERHLKPDMPGITGIPDEEGPPRVRAPYANRIRWLNYVDNGDPVGFELDTARWWMAEYGFDQLFTFTPADDYYFTRYPVPGKAHTDYWEDADVFQHFIMKVVAPPATATEPPEQDRRDALANGPRSKFKARIFSYIVAYAIPLVAVFAAVYFLCKGVEQYLDPKGDLDHPHLIRNVFALGGLLAGTTVFLRITQLVRHGALWNIGGLLIYAAFAALFYFGIVRTDDLSWFNTLPPLFGVEWADPRKGLILLSGGLVVITMLSNARWLRRILLALVPKKFHMGIVAVALPEPDSASTPKIKAPAVRHPPLIRNALKTMLIVGGLILVINAGVYSLLYHPAKAPLWPIVIGGAAFLFLWRLSALVFDLVFIWHRYIRHSGALNFLRRTILPPGADKASPAAGGKM